jgi:NAD(P)-dependent dehydrogenase (short-subunit alcohol dehydrogenase family)
MLGMVDGKVVVVTGAGSGIGKDFALGFAKHGAKVVVNDISKTPDGKFAADTVVDEIRSAGGEAISAIESVADFAAANRIIESALDSFGRIDGIVNNAGIVRDRFVFKMSPDEWNAVIAVHLNGSFNMIRASAPYFKEQGSGAYVNMTSTSGLIGNFGQANYASAKMGVVGLSKSTAIDMAKFNVRSNCIAPWAWTAMTATIPADTPENIARIEKMKKMEASKIAPLAVYLCSDAAAHVSGQIFGVRANEIYFFSQIRMLRSVHRSEGWTPEEIAEHAMPAFESNFYPNVPSMTLMPWDPI